MRFLLDENVHRKLLSLLNQKGHDVKLSPKGLVNGKVLALAIKEARTLITHDADFAMEAPTHSHPGIILVKIPSKELEALKTAFERFVLKERFSLSLADKLFLLFVDHCDEFPFMAEEYGA